MPILSLMPQRVTMLRASCVDLLDVVLGAGRPRAVDDLFGRAAAEHADDARAQVRLGIVVAIGRRPLVGDAERLAARHDRHALHRVGARDDEAEDRVTALVIRDALAVFAASAAAGAPGRGRSSRARRGSPSDAPRLRSRRAASSAASLTRFFRSAPERPGSRSGERREVDIARERHLARVHLQDRLASLAVGQVHDHATVEAARAQQRPIEHVGLVGRREHDDAFAAARSRPSR